MESTKHKPQGAARWLFVIAQKTGTIALIAAAGLSLLLIVNYLQTKSVDPLNSQAITRLMSELQENPRDENLKEQIRALDLLARKAYFTHRWQLQTGSYLLFALILVALVSFKYLSSFESSLPDLTRGPPAGESWAQKLLSRRYVKAGGLALLALAFILGIVSQSELRRVGLPASRGSAAAGDAPDLKEVRRNWPNFRGPEGIGIAHHTDVPLEWDGPSGRNILWKKPVPLPGFNSPILWGKKLFMSGGDRRTQVVYCIDADSGETIWEHAADDVPGTPERKPRPTEDTGFAAPTMATDGSRVFAIFATGDVVCLDFAGKRLWARNLGVPENHYGHSSSLIVHRDRLMVQYDQNTGGRLLGLQCATGRTLFDVPRDVEISWASPILVNTGSRTELILNSNPFVISHDPNDGRELWRVRCMQGEIAPSLGYWEGMVFAVNEYARLAAITLGETPEIAWEHIDDLSEVASPLAAKGLIFMPASYGTITCLDARTGEPYWLEEYEEGFYSSPILAGDRVYLMDMAGVTHIFKAAKEFQSLARNELGEEAMTIPAFMHDRIYIRGVEHLYCIGK